MNEPASQSIPVVLHKVMVDPALERKEIDGFRFPLGGYPTEEMKPQAGYTMQFEPADGSDPSQFAGANFAEDLEEWPDRYVYDILISHDRLRPLCRAILAMLPGRFFPILDVLGHDAYREIDPHIAYDLVGCEKFFDAIRFYEPWFFEDGLVGFGALSIDPFIYVFIDEHKIVTVRVTPDGREKLEKLLAAFDLMVTEELRGADFVAHEHRAVLSTPEDRADLLTPDEVIERLRDNWSLQLNIDPTTNADGEGNELGITDWQCVVRCTPPEELEPDSYAEVLLTAGSLQQAEELATDAVNPGEVRKAHWDEVGVIRADRITPDQLTEWLGADKVPEKRAPGVHDVRWLTGGPLAQREEEQEKEETQEL